MVQDIDDFDVARAWAEARDLVNSIIDCCKPIVGDARAGRRPGPGRGLLADISLATDAGSSTAIPAWAWPPAITR